MTRAREMILHEKSLIIFQRTQVWPLVPLSEGSKLLLKGQAPASYKYIEIKRREEGMRTYTLLITVLALYICITNSGQSQWLQARVERWDVLEWYSDEQQTGSQCHMTASQQQQNLRQQPKESRPVSEDVAEE